MEQNGQQLANGKANPEVLEAEAQSMRVANDPKRA